MERFYFFSEVSEFLNPLVREVVGDEHFIVLLADINHSWTIFFTSTEPIETNAEPFVIDKIA